MGALGKYVTLAIMLFVATAASAQDQDLARIAREQGVTVSFEEILHAARSVAGQQAQLLDAELGNLDGRILVNVYFRGPYGQIMSIQVDGKDKSIISTTGVNSPSPEPERSALGQFVDQIFGEGLRSKNSSTDQKDTEAVNDGEGQGGKGQGGKGPSGGGQGEGQH